LPELIVDPKLVDCEQIYQQLQLYSNLDNDESTSVNSLTKFFSKCLVQLNKLSFNVDLTKKSLSNGNLLLSSDSKLSANNEDSDEADREDESADETEDDEDEEEDEGEDSLDEMIKFSKSKLAASNKSKEEVTYGIPDGSDSEISDFEVNPDAEEGDDDEEEEDGVDLVDMFPDEDEKETLGIGKPTKAFDQVDFDREDFGFEDDEEEEEEENGDGEQNGHRFEEDDDEEEEEGDPEKSSNLKSKSKNLFDVNDEKANQANKSSFEIRQEKVRTVRVRAYKISNLQLKKIFK
jgi:hypothetical protein